MSEYQYFEFLAIDRPLDAAERGRLREISSRARITATSFTNHYEWGDFGGDPNEMMERWFDLHLYFANWGTRRLMMRLPRRWLDWTELDAFGLEPDWVDMRESGENLIVDICFEELELDFDDWDESTGWLSRIAPLRAEVMAGDLRLFYLLWLVAVEYDTLPDEAVEPIPGIGPLTGALEAFADFFAIDSDLVTVAAEQPFDGGGETLFPDASRDMLAAMSDREKSELLMRMIEGDPLVSAELKRRARQQCRVPIAVSRTAGDLRARAEAIREARERAAAERRHAEQRRRARQEARARRARLNAIIQRGEAAWIEIENEIQRRDGLSYDRAVGLLADLKAIAKEQNSLDDFTRRLKALRERHAKKGRFLERLVRLESP